MLNIAICDDDLNIVRKMKSLIESYEKAKCLINTYISGEELLKIHGKFDVIFLDIDMSGMDGIETAKEIRSYDKKNDPTLWDHFLFARSSKNIYIDFIKIKTESL